MGDISRILCSTINRSLCTLYPNKNISTFLINGAFIAGLYLALLLVHPIVGHRIERLNSVVIAVSLVCDRAEEVSLFSEGPSASVV